MAGIKGTCKNRRAESNFIKPTLEKCRSGRRGTPPERAWLPLPTKTTPLPVQNGGDRHSN